MTKYCFVGIDIGRYQNHAFFMDNERNKIKEFPFMQTHVGYEKLISEISSIEKQGFTPIVAAEGHSGNMAPLDEYLLAEGIIVKPVHPTSVNRHKKEDYALTSQIRRAATSIHANIAEAFGRYHRANKLNFYYNARGSLCETKSHLHYMQKVEYIDKEQIEQIIKKLDNTWIQINLIIKSIRKTQ